MLISILLERKHNNKNNLTTTAIEIENSNRLSACIYVKAHVERNDINITPHQNYIVHKLES